MAEKTIDHLNLDLDGDGILEKYNLQDTRVDGNLINYTYNNGKLSINGGLAYTKSSANNYSTQEKIVGTWINGKTIYERTITSIPTAIPDIDNIIDFKGAIFANDVYIPISISYDGVSNIFAYPQIDSNGNLTIVKGDGITINNINITIQYTKN